MSVLDLEGYVMACGYVRTLCIPRKASEMKERGKSDYKAKLSRPSLYYSWNSDIHILKDKIIKCLKKQLVNLEHLL